MKKILLAGVLGIGLFSACNDNYLEKYPLTSLTEQNAFLDYSNYKAYMYPCYELFTNTTIQTNFKENSLNSQRYGDWYAGLVIMNLIRMHTRPLLKQLQEEVGIFHILDA